MNIELIVQNNENGTIYDLSKIVKDIKFDTEIHDNPGKLTFKIINLQSTNLINEGSPISFKVNNTNMFWGYVFKINKSKDNNINITAYDQLRYLKSKDTYVLSKLSCEGIFKKVCTDKQINYRVVNTSSHLLPARINDNKSYAEIIQYGFDKTLIDTGKWYFMRDNFGTLELLEVSQQFTNLVIGDGSLLTEYNYESSIDNETYNQIKLVKENKKTKKREIYIVKDSSNMKKWGTLQFFETITEEVNEAQIKERANMLLKRYNKLEKTLKLDCIGDLRVKVGCGIYLSIKDLENDVPYNKFVIVTKVTHEFNNNKHMMNLEVKVI